MGINQRKSARLYAVSSTIWDPCCWRVQDFNDTVRLGHRYIARHVCAFRGTCLCLSACTAEICFSKDSPCPHPHGPYSNVCKTALLFKTWAHQFPWSLSVTLLWNLHSESFRHDGRKVMKVFSSKLTLSSETKLIAYVLLYRLFVNLAAKNVCNIF